MNGMIRANQQFIIAAGRSAFTRRAACALSDPMFASLNCPRPLRGLFLFSSKQRVIHRNLSPRLVSNIPGALLRSQVHPPATRKEPC